MNAVRGASLAAAVMLLGDSALYAALPYEAGRLGLSPIEVGVLLAANRLVRLVLNRPVGTFVDRHGARGALVPATVIAALTTAGYGLFSRSFLVLLALRVTWGLAWSIVRLSAFVAIVESGPGRRGALMGEFNAIARAGSFVAVLAGGALVDAVGFERAFLALGLGTLPALPLVLRTYASGRGAGAAESTPAPRLPDETALLVAAVLVAIVGPGLLTTSAGARVDALRGTAPFLAPATLAGVALGGRWGASIVVSWVAGDLTDRLGRRAVAIAGGAIATLALVGSAASDRLDRFVPCVVLAFVGLAVLQAATDALAQDLAARSSSPVIALRRYADALDVGSAVGSAAIGLTDPRLGLALGLDHLYAASTVATLAAAGVAVALASRPRSPRDGGNLEPRG